MDCAHCDTTIDKQTEHFELHHHQPGSEPVLQHIFCCSGCLRDHLAG